MLIGKAAGFGASIPDVVIYGCIGIDEEQSVKELDRLVRLAAPVLVIPME